MNIVVCVKQVPAIEQVKLDPVTKTLVREGVDLRTNSLDRRALTQAIKLREEQGGNAKQGEGDSSQDGVPLLEICTVG